MEKDKIINDLGRNFQDIRSRREIIKKYGGSGAPYFGTNEDGEDVELHIADSGIVLKTFQSNGWIRVNYFDPDGYAEGEAFDGKWT